MNLLVTVNSNYLRPLKIMLASFFEHTPGTHKIFFLHGQYMTESEMAGVKSLVESEGSLFVPIEMQQEIFSGLPVLDYFSVEMYYRLFAGMVLPEEEKKVLYLDPDILIRSSLLPLYKVELKEYVMAGVEDHAIKTIFADHKQQIGFPEKGRYINSGVLLINLKKLREDFRPEDMARLIREKGSSLCYPDQDMINLLFRGKIKVLKRKYNYNTGYGTMKEMVRYLAGGFLRERRYPVIIHYMGKTKPWHLDYYGKFGKEYRRYLKPYLSLHEQKQWRKRWLAVGGHLYKAIRRKLTGDV